MKISVVKRPQQVNVEPDCKPTVNFYDLASEGLSTLKLGQEVSVTVIGKVCRISQSKDCNNLEVEYEGIDVKAADGEMSKFVSEIEDD